MIAYCVGASIVLMLAWVFAMHRAELVLQRVYREGNLAAEVLPVIREYRITLSASGIGEANAGINSSFTQSLDLVQAMEALVARMQAVHRVPLQQVSYWLVGAAQRFRQPGGGHYGLVREIHKLSPKIPSSGSDLIIRVRGRNESVEAVTLDGSLLDHPVGACLALEWFAQERFSLHAGERALAIEVLLDGLAVAAATGRIGPTSVLTPLSARMIRERGYRSMTAP